MSAWVAALAELAAAGQPAVLGTVLRAEGSTPREAGAKMVVTPAALTGTVGGGHPELAIVEEARALLERAARGEDVSAPVSASSRSAPAWASAAAAAPPCSSSRCCRCAGASPCSGPATWARRW